MPIDAVSLGKILDKYWPILVEWIGGTREGSEDIVQAAFIKLAAEDPPPENCAAWLFTVVKRLAINEKISHSKRRLRETNVGSRKVQAADTSNEIEIRDLLNSLDIREKEIIIAKIWGELTFDEIGKLFGEPKASIWRSYKVGLSKLHLAYKEDSQ